MTAASGAPNAALHRYRFTATFEASFYSKEAADTTVAYHLKTLGIADFDLAIEDLGMYGPGGKGLLG